MSVQAAMNEGRPAKAAIRELWMSRLGGLDRVETAGKDEPLYVTLCGADGFDIHAAVSEGVIRLAETGGIAQEHLWKIVAIEQDNEAVLTLQRTFPGLRILDQNLKSLLKGDGHLAWPSRRERSVWRATCINMDLNSSFEAREDGRGIYFPVASWIYKIAEIHADQTPKNWCLFLTLNASINWNQSVWIHVSKILRENASEHSEFAEGLASVVSEGVVESIMRAETSMPSIETDDAHGLLLAIVPKQICQFLPDAWAVEIDASLRYGGGSSMAAPMVSFIVNFVHDGELAGRRDVAYQRSIQTIFSSTNYVDDSGIVHAIS